MGPLGQAGEHQQCEHDGIELVLHNAARCRNRLMYL